METFPKIGMTHRQVRSRLKRYDANNKFGNTQMKESLLNQAKLAEGQGASDDLRTEHDHNNHSSNRLGWSTKYGNNFESIFSSR